MTAFDPTGPRGAFREAPYMGVIFVVHEAVKRGFYNGHPEWCNLGQGQPEVGVIDGAPPRLDHVSIQPADHAYGPLEGIPELREVVAAHYNRLYRRGEQPYAAKNVAIVQGGRLGLTRALAALGPVVVGYQTPDYTAYEDMLSLHLARIDTVAVRTRPEDGFVLDPDRFEAAVVEHGISAFVLSNPCNPTGALIEAERLRAIVGIARKRHVTLLLDEFYSHFVYTESGAAGAGPVSGAQHVIDVERDPVVLIDGLTKSFRYPGWRMGWAVGPSAMIESMARLASSIDGGPSRIAQRAAIEVLAPERADLETKALRVAFAKKRELMLSTLKRLGVRFPLEPRGTFYCFGDLSDLPAPYSNAMEFFWRALDRQVMTVPGDFFDVNPGKYRHAPSPYAHWMRFSFGPPIDNVRLGLDRLTKMLEGSAG